MSSDSPSRRLRTKTSDITDFFRVSTTHGHQSRQTQVESHPVPASSLLVVPSAQEPSTALKKMATKIPFLGRTRKKSTHSVASGTLSSTSSRGHDSSELADMKNVDRLSHPVTPPEPTRHPPLPTTLPPINVSSPSLGSKFAAHFSHPKSRKSATPPQAPSQATAGEASSSSTLSPPISPRATSFDSASSDASRNRSPTPRPARPTITVSLSPDNVEDYKDLFTLPRSKVISKSQPASPTGRYQDRDNDSNITLSPTPPTSPRMHFPNPPLDSRLVGVRQHEVAQRDSLNPTEHRPSSESLKRTRKHSADAQKRLGDALGNDVDLDSTEESVSSPRNTHPPELAPAIDINLSTPATQRRHNASTMPHSVVEGSLARIRHRTPSSSTERPSRPPSMPLPPPPSNAVSVSTTPSLQPLPSHRSMGLPPGSLSSRRPRAHTIGSAESSTAAAASITASSTSSEVTGCAKSAAESIMAVKHTLDHKTPNLDTVTPEQLKQALATCNQQYDELASYLLKVTATHVAEKNAMEKKISSLEKEATRKDKEIKGLTWLIVNNRGLPPTTASGTGVAPRSATTLESSHLAYRSQSPTPTKLSFRRFQGTDDSGAESHQTSGAESFRGSGTSGTESLSSLRTKKLKRPQTIGETSYNLYRSPSSAKSVSGRSGLGIDSIVPDMPYVPSPGKRSSVYSLSSSATSSASSLLSPSPSPSATMSSLSAIPEAPSSSLKAPRDQATRSASDQEADERRATRTSRRISGSSSTSLAAATNAYASNLKRGRPPSIAQVLEKSPNMEDMLEKMRPSSSTVAPST